MIFGVVAMVLFAACEKQDIEPATKTISLNASMAQVAADTKTVFGGDGKSIEWFGGEQILVMDKNGVKATLTATVPGKTTTITGEVPDDFVETEPYYAFYPADKFGEVDLRNYTIKLTIPATQASINGLENGANPSYAKVEGAGMVSFKNICSIVKITAKAGDTGKELQKIRLYGVSYTGGLYNFDYETGDIWGSSTAREIAINTDWTPSAVDETISAYFVVAPVNQFLRVYANDYSGMNYIVTSSSMNLTAGKMYNMPELTWVGGNLTK